jgi:hypothetical protein
MVKDKAGELFDREGNQIYRFRTPYGTSMNDGKRLGNPLVIYAPDRDPEYAELLRKGRNKELGELPGGLGFVLGESKHTTEMLDRSVVAVADDDGTIDTIDRDVALYIAAKFPLAKLDRGSDQSLLDELANVKKADNKTRAERARDISMQKQSRKEMAEKNAKDKLKQMESKA